MYRIMEMGPNEGHWWCRECTLATNRLVAFRSMTGECRLVRYLLLHYERSAKCNCQDQPDVTFHCLNGNDERWLFMLHFVTFFAMMLGDGSLNISYSPVIMSLNLAVSTRADGCFGWIPVVLLFVFGKALTANSEMTCSPWLAAGSHDVCQQAFGSSKPL